MKTDNGETTREEIDRAIEGVRNGDANAFSQVIRAYHVPLRALIGAQVADQHDTDDIAQQTFVFAFQHLDEYQLGTNLLAWLRAIARNKVKAHFKARAQTNKNLQGYRMQLLLQRSMELVDGAALEERLAALSHCTEGLPPKQRGFLHETNNRKSTLAELAVKLGRSAPAIRKQVSRIYDSLRHCIKKRLQEGRG